MKLTIKNMVCNHCIAALKFAFSDLSLTPVSIELGRAEIEEDLNDEQLARLSRRLESSGFELITNPDRDLVESVKREIINMVRSDRPQPLKLSEFISERLKRDYRTVSRIFSDLEGRTIESYTIMQKIERVKELLIDGQMNISEIAYITGYSSTGHLSRQFKEITGMTPSEFKVNGHRIALNEV